MIQYCEQLGAFIDLPDGEPMHSTDDSGNRIINPRVKLHARAFTCVGCNQVCQETYDPRHNRTQPRGDERGEWCAECLIQRKHQDGACYSAVEVHADKAYELAELHQVKPQLRRLLEQWPNKIPLILLGGDVGRGKTHALWAAVKALGRRGVHVRVESGASLRERFISSMPEQRRHLSRALVTVRCLALDDLFRPAATDGWREFVESIIDQRINAGLPTMITSHSSPSELTQYGKAVQSRLSRFIVVVFDGPDRRRV